jgi:predicted nuclease of predicted toxin-antitoxin system
MRWMVDECVPPEIVVALRNEGHDVLAALESHRGQSDEFLFALAVREQRILLTEDNDFSTLAFVEMSGAAIPAIVRIRIPSERKALKIARLIEIVNAYADMLLGHYTVIDETRVRFRPLAG